MDTASGLPCEYASRAAAHSFIICWRGVTAAVALPEASDCVAGLVSAAVAVGALLPEAELAVAAASAGLLALLLADAAPVSGAAADVAAVVSGALDVAFVGAAAGLAGAVDGDAPAPLVGVDVVDDGSAAACEAGADEPEVVPEADAALSPEPVAAVVGAAAVTVCAGGLAVVEAGAGVGELAEDDAGAGDDVDVEAVVAGDVEAEDEPEVELEAVDEPVVAAVVASLFATGCADDAAVLDGADVLAGALAVEAGSGVDWLATERPGGVLIHCPSIRSAQTVSPTSRRIGLW